VGKRITVKLYDGKDSVKKIVRRRGNVIYWVYLPPLIQGYDFIIYIKNTIAYCKWVDLINGETLPQEPNCRIM
jgi:hypothetical protein